MTLISQYYIVPVFYLSCVVLYLPPKLLFGEKQPMRNASNFVNVTKSMQKCKLTLKMAAFHNLDVFIQTGVHINCTSEENFHSN